MTGQQQRNHMAEAARQAAERAERGRMDPEPSLGARLGQIGVVGWMTVAPILLALLLGRWLDQRLAAGIFYTAAFLVAGAATGFWLAWRWMHRRL